MPMIISINYLHSVRNETSWEFMEGKTGQQFDEMIKLQNSQLTIQQLSIKGEVVMKVSWAIVILSSLILVVWILVFAPVIVFETRDVVRKLI